MADDLVAELTLRLINETNAGIGEIRGEFDDLAGSAGLVTDGLSELEAELRAIQMPVGLADGFADVRTEAESVVNSIEDIGSAILADIAKAKELQGALADIHGGGAGGGGGNGGWDGGASAGPDDGSSSHGNFVDEAVAGAGGGVASRLAGSALSAMSEAFLGYIAFDVAKDAAQKYADFDWTLTHIAMTDKLSGSAATDEVDRLYSKLSDMALQTGTSSSDLADAYSFLVTTGMNRNLIDQMMPALAETSTAYNVPVADQAQAVFTLNHNLDIGPDDMSSALGMLAYAGKIGHFNLADFGNYLPGIGAQFGMLGVTGMRGEDIAASALETVRGVVGDSQSAATDLGDLMSYMTSPIAIRFFDRTKRSQDLLGKPILDMFDKYHIHGLDLPKYFDQETDKGIDPLDAMVDYMHAMHTQDMSYTDQMAIFGSLFHNTEAAKAMIGLEENYDLFHKDQDVLGSVNPHTVDTDFQTASNTPEIALRKMDESFDQLAREVGTVLIPAFDLLSDTMVVAARGIGGARDWLTHETANSNPTNPHMPHFGSAFQPHPITINVHVDKSGNVTAGAPQASASKSTRAAF